MRSFRAMVSVCAITLIQACSWMGMPSLDDLGGIAANYKNDSHLGEIYIIDVTHKFLSKNGYDYHKPPDEEKFYRMLVNAIDERKLMESYCQNGYELIRHINYYEGGAMSGIVRCKQSVEAQSKN